MSYCPFKLVDGKWKCPLCNWVYPLKAEKKPPRRNCPGKPSVCQVGDRLHKILREKLGVEVTNDCSCGALITLMNALEPKDCRGNINFIVNTMITTAEKRKWKMDGRLLLSVVARFGTKTPVGRAFARSWARKLVMQAIEECEE